MPKAPPPPLNEARMDVVLAAWHKLAGDADAVPLNTLKDAYDATRHPRVLDGNMSVGMAKEIIGRHFDSVPDGIVTWTEFLQYHVRMSNEIDRSRSINPDEAFVNIVVMSWKLDKDPRAALFPTGIIPATLDCPKGLAGTRNLDLIWTDPASTDGKGLLAFRGSVKCRFGRGELPESIRGYFAFAEELTEYRVKTCTSKSALINLLNIVWLDEQTGEAVGFQGVVSPNVDLAQLPQALQNILWTDDNATKQFGSVRWLPLQAVRNPAYKKSSEAFGEGAEESALSVLTLKKKVFEGTNCGVAWHGHTGKFTDSFNGGPFKFSGFNTAPRR